MASDSGPGRHQLSLPVLISLSRHATSASPEVRYSALSSLSRALLGPLVAVPPADVAEVFQRVLYPLLEVLIAAPSDAEMTESRLRASTLLCKAFMRFDMNDNVTGQDVTERWLQVLDYLERLMRTDQSDQLVRPPRLLSSKRAIDGRVGLSSRKLFPSHSKM